MIDDELSLHDLVSGALERAALAQQESYELIERQEAVTAALHDTLDCIRRRRTFGNGHRGAKGPARPG